MSRTKKPRPNPRQIRRMLLTRWLELAEDFEHLDNAIRHSPQGAFTADELDDCRFVFSQIWDAMANQRPKLNPSSAERRARWKRYLERVARRKEADAYFEQARGGKAK